MFSRINKVSVPQVAGGLFNSTNREHGKAGIQVKMG
jgi:hypothetical protein